MMDQIIEWNNNEINLPLFITGAKYVGKTFVANEFAKTFYENVIYINLEKNVKMHVLFENSDVNQTIHSILTYFGHLDEQNFILILDEISACENACNFLSIISTYNTMNQTKIKVIAISSQNISSQYKSRQNNENITFLRMFPMDIEEFLSATGNEWYIAVIKEHFSTNMPIPEIVHQELLTLFRYYLVVGGMPAAINEYINMESIINVSEPQNQIINTYLSNTYAPKDESEIYKMKQIYETIPMQLAKENKKFCYKLIKRGATKKSYEIGIDELVQSQVIIKCSKLNDITSFKLYLSDVGLLYSNINPDQVITSDQRIENDIRKGIFENYVAQQLNFNGYEVNFWESHSQAKIEFVIEKNCKLIPIELKTTDYTRSKSMNVFQRDYKIDYGIKVSTRNFALMKGIKYVPIYAVFCI